ncbi:hypothetical protein, partial [Thermoactinomyces daqus]
RMGSLYMPLPIQAYQYEKEECVPQPIEMIDDSTIDEIVRKKGEIHGYDENWARALREYLLTRYSPASSDKNINRSEILSQI